MKSITDIGIIIAALILSAGMMFSSDKELTAWLFIFLGVVCFVKFIKIEIPPDPKNPPTS
jgi:1,4-dihydroxy-2-naphthoate octaprenyltransferase